MAALAKVAAICIGTAGGAAACVATGLVPAPVELAHDQTKAPAIERRINPDLAAEWSSASGVDYETAPEPTPAPPQPAAEPTAKHEPEPAPEPAASPVPEATSGATEYVPPPPAPVAVSEPSGESAAASPSAGSPAGEFGP
jgi:hypothetical protein